MFLPRAITDLIESFERLPGIGPKSAARLVFYLLHVPQEDLDRFSLALSNLRLGTLTCSICCNVSETDPCPVCSSALREDGVVIVVEQPLDVLAFERSGAFKGKYHVLHGALSPMNNITPSEIRVAELLARLKEGRISEVILAMNHNLEGEGTALYLTQEIKKLSDEGGLLVRVTRLAKGIPVGGEIEYADEVTLGRALEGRVEV